MAQSYEFYKERAKEAAARANKADLDNVRDKELRAEKTWLGLAQQARAVARQREKTAAEKAAEREAQQA